MESAPLRELLGYAFFRDQPFQDLEVEHDFPRIGRRTMHVNARRIPKADGRPRSVLLADEDITKRQEEAEVRYRRMFESATDGILIFNAEDETLSDVNPAFLSLMAYGRQELIGPRITSEFISEKWPKTWRSFAQTRLAQCASILILVPIELDVTKAVPCGLIINEMVTNSLKHAFPDQRPGVIDVSFRCEEERCFLTIADNGIGLPKLLATLTRWECS